MLPEESWFQNITRSTEPRPPGAVFLCSAPCLHPFAEVIMHIVVNGRTLDAAPGQTLHGLIVTMDLDPSVVVAELNGDIVPGAKFEGTALHAGDRLELLSFVGGG